ncbi:ATP-binding protein [Streptomyces sp. NPDC021093]|uniref:ATP-binding protein n=1 Tax=Streptomyces sp. NPDC021093 TaxID=3365112 RepID=UPI00379E09F5
MNETTQAAQPPLLREKWFRRDRRSVPAARAFARWALEDWSMRALVDDVLLCVSELTTNALEHGVPRGRGFQLRVLAESDLLRIEVHDSGGGTVAVGRPELECEYGRGLLLVGLVADRWGVGEREVGKVVWCEFEGDGGQEVVRVNPGVPLRGSALQPVPDSSRS